MVCGSFVICQLSIMWKWATHWHKSNPLQVPFWIILASLHCFALQPYGRATFIFLSLTPQLKYFSLFDLCWSVFHLCIFKPTAAEVCVELNTLKCWACRERVLLTIDQCMPTLRINLLIKAALHYKLIFMAFDNNLLLDMLNIKGRLHVTRLFYPRLYLIW